jgi:hypothetical protein
MKNEFTTPELEIIGIKRDAIKEWLARGYVRPSIKEAGGRGTKHVFDRDDVYTIFLFKELISQGLSRKLAGEIVKQFFYDLSRFSKAIKNGTPYFVITRVAVHGEEPSMHGQLIKNIPKNLPPTFVYQWAFNLTNIRDRVDAMIE